MHPFWIETGGDEGKAGFLAARSLRAGDQLRLGDGSPAYVTGVEATGIIEPVYNFSVDGWKTYHVGELGVWVHNDNCFDHLPEGFAPSGRNLHGKPTFKDQNGRELYQGDDGRFYDSVEAPSTWRPLNNSLARELSQELGFREVRDVPFNRRGQLTFERRGRYITPDVDGHHGGVWKMFDRNGVRLGTYDASLTRIDD